MVLQRRYLKFGVYGKWVPSTTILCMVTLIVGYDEMWDLLENEPLFRAQNSASRHDPQAHLAEMMTILGPPPKELLNEGRKTSSHFDANGK